VKRLGIALLALIAIGAAPPAGEPSAEERYQAGVAARIAGDPQRAIPLLEAAARLEPDNADVHLQLGLALLAAGELDRAEASLRRTLALAPDYGDAREALDRLDQRRRAPEAAAVPDLRWRLDVDGSYSALDRGRTDWQEGSVRLSYVLDEDTSVAGAVEVVRRFGRTDTYGEVRVDQRFDGGSVYVALGGTPDADFRPEWQISAGGAVRVRGGSNPTSLTLDARQAHYPVGDIQTVSPGVEQYILAGRAWLTGRLINVFDETGRHSLGWTARGDVMATRRLRLFAGLADAPDTSEGVVVETFSVFGGLAWDVDERTTVRLSAAFEDRETGSDRLQLGLGLGLRF
jgi:YaiO family outer membrane protein